ncbi:hypothetical protein [Flavobacterium rhizosphaerae]|uniref:Uncharacterized protein n=1 Tax=Flavobacterium rhizosphaerae TaxID=3163298 RepID=A0ABW8YRD8_9FLAO
MKKLVITFAAVLVSGIAAAQTDSTRTNRTTIDTPRSTTLPATPATDGAPNRNARKAAVTTPVTTPPNTTMPTNTLPPATSPTPTTGTPTQSGTPSNPATPPPVTNPPTTTSPTGTYPTNP